MTRHLLPLLWGCTAGSDATSEAPFSPGSILGEDLFVPAEYDDTPITGMILYSIVGNGQGEEDPPYIIGKRIA